MRLDTILPKLLGLEKRGFCQTLCQEDILERLGISIKLSDYSVLIEVFADLAVVGLDNPKGDIPSVTALSVKVL